MTLLWTIGLAFAIYCLLTYVFSYWERRGVTQLTPSWLFGNVKNVFFLKASIGEIYCKLYEESTKLPFVGVYVAFRPFLLVNDPALMKNVLIRDFHHFTDRGLRVDERNDPISGNLFMVPNPKWRNLRVNLTPAFTSGKLKAMFPIILDIGDRLLDHIDQHSTEEIDARDLLARFTTDIIASVGFGVEIDSINNTTFFRQIGVKIFEPTFRGGLRWLGMILLPVMNSVLGLKVVDQDVEDFLIDLVRKTIEYRESSGVVRKDIMQLMLQLRNSGSVSAEDQWDIQVSKAAKQLSIEELAAQAFVFFVAGYDTSSTTMSYCLFELARNPEMQKKVQREIKQCTVPCLGKLTYENLHEIKYLECCILETLRKYPALPYLNRECTKDYQIPGTQVEITKGTPLVLPILGVHRDPKYFPEPLRFDPDRFASYDKNDSTKPFFPFGAGPRNCIGMRLGMIQTKLGLAMCLQNYTVSLARPEQRQGELPISATTPLMAPKDGIYVRVQRHHQ
ncbi:probable cytochrome P450 6d5 [Uranotaenia lowii]|uniref:probable cytochrome P450 6d5 n=1 Tax=Uranotaenia lowii TaxID=190385 RepID=UPI00247AF816|nr:probable cytochrome P450 6d5 [Uranotaenia lowii]